MHVLTAERGRVEKRGEGARGGHELEEGGGGCEEVREDRGEVDDC